MAALNMEWYYILAYAAAVVAIAVWSYKRGYVEGWIERSLEAEGYYDGFEDDDIEVDEGLALMAELKALEAEDEAALQAELNLTEGLQQAPFDYETIEEKVDDPKPAWLYEQDGEVITSTEGHDYERAWQPYSEVEK